MLVILKRCVNRNDQSIFESKFRVTGASCQGWIHFLTRQHRQYVNQVQVHDGNLRQIEGSQKNLLALATVQRNITNVTSAAEGEDAGNESNDKFIGPDQGEVDRRQYSFESAMDGQARPVRHTEAETIRSALTNTNRDIELPNAFPSGTSQHPIPWPVQGAEPLSEFNTEGLFSMCYPSIFSYGSGDPTDNSRRHTPVSLADFGMHLVKYAAFVGDIWTYPLLIMTGLPSMFAMLKRDIP